MNTLSKLIMFPTSVGIGPVKSNPTKDIFAVEKIVQYQNDEFRNEIKHDIVLKT